MRTRTACFPLLTLLLGSLCLGASAAERSAADVQRDAIDQPQQILAFAGIAPGMQVADLFAGGGYYSELLQELVGDQGHVLLYNNPGYAGYGAKGLEQRFANGRLAQIDRRVASTSDMDLVEASLDRALMVMAFHDLYWVDEKQGWNTIDRAGFIRQVVRALKPGGALLIVDHSAVEGSEDAAVNALHRIDEGFVRRQLQAHGLRLEAASELLRNAEDPRTASVFDAGIRGRTDRFVHLYRKSE